VKPSRGNCCNIELIIFLKKGSNFRAGLSIVLLNNPGAWVVRGLGLKVRPLDGNGNGGLVPELVLVGVGYLAAVYFSLEVTKNYLNSNLQK
jgi:hypothetical protein